MNTRKKINLKVVNPLLDNLGGIPQYGTEGAAAVDLRACIEQVYLLEPGARKLIGTGIAIDIQDPSLAAMVASRSGLALKHGCRVSQGLGIIDSDYHGEIGVILQNDSDKPFEINPGERIAQLVFMPVVQVNFNRVDEFETTTERGEGGFGSTGVK